MNFSAITFGNLSNMKIKVIVTNITLILTSFFKFEPTEWLLLYFFISFPFLMEEKKNYYDSKYQDHTSTNSVCNYHYKNYIQKIAGFCMFFNNNAFSIFLMQKHRKKSRNSQRKDNQHKQNKLWLNS